MALVLGESRMHTIIILNCNTAPAPWPDIKYIHEYN